MRSICKKYQISFFFLLIIFIGHNNIAGAQSRYGINDTIISGAVVYEGDTIEAKILAGVYVWTKRTKPEWTRLRNAIYVTYPYAKRAGYVFNDIEKHIANNTDKKFITKYINSREKELKKEFTNPLTNLSVYQGKVLMKLINRETGGSTCYDILKELKKPGLDPRNEAQVFEFANIYSIDDVHVSMIVPGQVTNLTRFGAFVDIGVKQDGLVHVSEIAHKYITDPGEVLKLNDKVMVKVMEVDTQRKRIALSIKQTQEAPNSRQPRVVSHQPGTKNHQQSRPKQEEKESGSMEDAMSLLRKKFGK